MSNIKITWEELEKIKTPNGGYLKKTINKCKALSGSDSFIKGLLGKEVCSIEWEKITSCVKNISDKKKKSLDKKKDSKRRKRKAGNNGKTAAKKQKLSTSNRNEFYSSDAWRFLRIRVLEKYECKCMMCGRSPKKHGIVIHVDHIKPRSKFPELSLEYDNLQLLCEDCNLGKSNKYETDWRPETIDLTT
jgi:5-methylcytosine-specific restriction endonuclease McrA